MSSNFYVACELGEDCGRVWLGTLHKEGLTVSEVRRFQIDPVVEKKSVHWSVPQICEEILGALRGVAAHEEPVASISCHSWAADSLLFAPDGSLITPVYHHRDTRTESGMEATLARVPWEEVYAETGVQPTHVNTLFQLATEKPRRLDRAGHFLPLADAFNFLLGGDPRSERSLASMTQLFNPTTGAWSEGLIKKLKLAPKIFPGVVPAGTKLGKMRPEIAGETGLADTRVMASCSHEIAAGLAGIPAEPGESWAFLRLGNAAVIGTELPEPLINDATRQMNMTNQPGAAGTVAFYKHAAGLWILDECKRYWKQRERDLDDSVLRHLAVSAPAFESLIDFADPRFFTPGDMPLKIQQYCEETRQEIPRKPGPVLRCILESLALHFRNAIAEIELLTGKRFSRLYLLNSPANSLLPPFTANALQLPVVVLPPEAAAIGNVLVQAVGQGHLRSLEAARLVARQSFRREIISPHTAVWNAASERLEEVKLQKEETE